MRLARWLIAPESRRNALVLAWIAVIGITVADDLTGKTLSLAACYLYPIILASWRGGRFWGFTVSVCSAVLVVLVAAHVGNPFSSALYFWIYVGSIVTSFIVVSATVVQLHDGLNEKAEQ